MLHSSSVASEKNWEYTKSISDCNFQLAATPLQKSKRKNKQLNHCDSMLDLWPTIESFMYSKPAGKMNFDK